MNLKLSGDRWQMTPMLDRQNRNSAAEFLKCIFSQDSLIQGITEYENDSKGLGFLD